MLLLSLVAPLAVIPTALAADDVAGFDAHGFVLTAMDGDPRDPLYVQRPGRFEQGDFFVGGLFEYAKSPLVLVTVDPDGNQTAVQDVLDDVFALNVSAGGAPLDRLRLDLSAPLYFTSTGEGGSPQGFGLGDIRASAMVAVLRPSDAPDGGGIGLGVIPYIDLPTGDASEFLGQGGVAGGGKVALTYETAKWTLGADIGAQFNPSIELDNLSNSDALTTGLAVGYLLDPTLGLNLEAHLASPFKASDQSGTAAPSEALLSVRKHMDSGGYLVGGAGAGLDRGASAAVFRLFLGGGFGKIGAPTPKIVDTDGDGLLDDVDTCVTEPETKNGVKDEDGCPDELGKVRVLVTKDGAAVDGAKVTLTGGDAPQDATSAAATPWVVESLPGKEWSAKATLGACYAGEGKVTAGEGTVDLAVPLTVRRDATVVYTVVDNNDRPVPAAEIRWEKDPEGCGPTEPLTLGADGTGKQNAGQGHFRVFVSAPGYATKDVTVDVPVSGEVPVRVQLPATKVKIEVRQIAILDKVFFETNSDVIKDESFDLLNEVAATIMAHPEIGRVEVAGHTDSDGSDAFNLDLSDRRAKSVRVYLEKRGVDTARLQAHGYGETRPIDTNKTAAGKAKNRRVEFNLIDAPAASVTPSKDGKTTIDLQKAVEKQKSEGAGATPDGGTKKDEGAKPK